MSDIIKKPIITEKMTAQGEKSGIYGFIVEERANKIEIRKAIENTYGVTIKKINTARYIGKQVFRATKTKYIKGRKTSYKKAIVTLKEGDSIDFFANV